MLSLNLSLLKDIVNTAPLPIAVLMGEEMKITLANDAIMKLWGKGNDIIGRRFPDILPELADQDVFQHAEAVLRTGVSYQGINEPFNIVVDGVLKKHYFNYNFAPVRDPQGGIIGLINTGVDVTDLNFANRQIAQAEQSLELATESANLGTYQTNFITDRIQSSPQFDTIWNLKQPIGHADLDRRLHPDDRHLRTEAYANARENDGHLSYEARIVHDDESVHWVRVRGKIISNTLNEPLTLIGIVQDVTDQHNASDQFKSKVRERTEALKRSNDDLHQFAYTVSHDLKEPARKIQVLSSMIKSDKGKTIAECIAYIDKIDMAAKRMTSLIDGILKYSTLNAATDPFDEIDLDEIINQITEDLELIINEKEAILVKDDFPKIEGVQILIHQLLYNLINNALKFSKPHEPPRVTISAEYIQHDHVPYIKIFVKDNGIGINAKHTDKIFAAFERLNAKENYEGNGLGLSLCKKIVERHHGTITVTGEENIGSEFIVTLPLRQPKSE